MTENAARLNLSGQAEGMVTAAQALHAKHQASRQRGQARRNQTKPKALTQDKAVETAVEQIVD
jgi:ProP effector